MALIQVSSCLKKYVLRWEVAVAVSILGGIGLYAVRFFLYEPFSIPSQSMHPTLPEGSFVLVSKLGFGNYGSGGFKPFRTQPSAPVHRGDIIVFGLPGDEQTNYIMRVIGLGGDQVLYSRHRLTINGVEVPTTLGDVEGSYQYASEIIDGRNVTIALMPERPSPESNVLVPEDHVFVLGDSRDNARDSRFIGFIPRANIVGVVVKRFGT